MNVEPVRPDVCAAPGIDQLYVHPHLLTCPPHAPFEQVANTEFAPDLLNVDGFALIRKRRVSGYYEALGNPRQICGEIVGDTVREIVLLRIVRQICEGQDDNGKPWHYWGGSAYLCHERFDRGRA